MHGQPNLGSLGRTRARYQRRAVVLLERFLGLVDARDSFELDEQLFVLFLLHEIARRLGQEELAHNQDHNGIH